MNDTTEMKQQVSELFNTVAHGYDNPSTIFFRNTASKLLDILQPIQNTQLLDIATGTGAVAINAAPMLLPAGQVHGIDLSKQMLSVAAETAKQMQLTNIQLYEMDAEQPVFDQAIFDYITCSFGIFFLPDMEAALNNWKKLLKPDGQLIFSSFGENSFATLQDLFYQRLADYGFVIEQPRWLLLATEQRCHDMLHRCGYQHIQTQTEQLGYYLENAEDWWQLLWNTGTRGFLEKLKPDELNKFKHDHLQEIQQLATDDGIWLNIEAIFSHAASPIS